MELLHYIAAMLGGTRQWNSRNMVPHCLGAVGNGTNGARGQTAWGHWVVELLQHTATLPKGMAPCNSCGTRPHCLWVVGSGIPATHRHKVGHCAVVLLHYTATLPAGYGQWNCFNTLPHCLGWGVGSGARAQHNHTAWGHWVAEHLQHAATLPGWAMGSGTPALHCRYACGRWARELTHYTTPLLGGSEEWSSCNTIPHCLGAVGSGQWK